MTSGAIPDPWKVGFMSEALNIPYPDDKVMIDYISVNQTLFDFQHKTKVLDKEPMCLEDIPDSEMNMFDTFELIDPRPELEMKPVAMFRDPFRRGPHKIVLCQFMNQGKVPMINTRVPCEEFLNQQRIKDEEPWVGWEQEYFVVDRAGLPIGWGFDTGFVDNWCYNAVDIGKQSGAERLLSEFHAKACLYAGIKFHGLNREEAVAQWEYQIGPGDMLTMADHLVVSRYLLLRCAEYLGTHVSFRARPGPNSDWSSCLHLNYSTNKMRREGGIKEVKEKVLRLAMVPQSRILPFYDRNQGEDCKKRLTGRCCVPSYDKFSWGLADKYCSVRIPLGVSLARKGYLEERRPCADGDPYMTSLAFMKALYTDEFLQEEEHK